MNGSAKSSVSTASRVREKSTLLLCCFKPGPWRVFCVWLGKRPELDTRQVSKGSTENLPVRPFPVMQHTSHHANWMGRLREMEQRQWEELHWSCSLLCLCHGPCLLLPGPGFVLQPQLQSDHSNYLLLPCQRGEKERRDGGRKAIIIMGSAFKFIYWEKMARTKSCFSNFAWWVFNTQENSMLTEAIISRRWQKKSTNQTKNHNTFLGKTPNCFNTIFSVKYISSKHLAPLCGKRLVQGIIF